MTGYLIEYQEKTSLFFKDEPRDNFTEERRALVKREILSQMLSTRRFLIFTAYLVDMDQYKMNHNKPLEIITRI